MLKFSLFSCNRYFKFWDLDSEIIILAKFWIEISKSDPTLYGKFDFPFINIFHNHIAISEAYKYDLFLREFDNKVELIGLVDDPTYNMKDFVGKEMLFPRKWVTLDVLETNMKVNIQWRN